MCLVAIAESQAEPQRLPDWAAFRTLDLLADWDMELFLVSESCRPVGRFKPCEVLVEAWSDGSVRMFWSPKRGHKRRVDGSEVVGGPAALEDREGDDVVETASEGGGAGSSSGSEAWSEAGADEKVLHRMTNMFVDTSPCTCYGLTCQTEVQVMS